MGRHVYWKGGVRPPRRGVHFLVVWVAVLVMFVISWQIAQLDPRLAPFVFGLLVVALALVIVAALRRQLSSPFVRELQIAELARLRGDVPRAIALGVALLRKPLGAHQQAQVLLMLGCCAESEGDFAEAAELFVRAEGTLRAGTMHAMVREQYLSLIAARRAFAHAALGDLQRARATLATTRLRDAFPAATTLARRAELVISAREGAFDRLASELRKNETLLRNTLDWRDRALVHALQKICGADATRASIDVEPPLRDWILGVLGPAAEAHVRGVS